MNGLVLNLAALWTSLTSPSCSTDNLPPLSDLQRFPSYDLCNDQLTFLATRRAWVQGERGLFADPMYSQWFDAVIDDLEVRREPWAVLYEAHGWVATVESMDKDDERRNYPADSRAILARRRLAELRRVLGPTNFSSGTMPALVDSQFWCR